MNLRAVDDAVFGCLLVIAGCGDPATATEGAGGSTSAGDTNAPVPTTSGADPTTMEPVLPECPDGDNAVWVKSAIEPCVDPACTSVEVDGFMPKGVEIDGELYGDIAFECQVQGVVTQDSEQWMLTGCTGADAPTSGAVQITFMVDPGPGLPLVPGERVRVAFHGGATYGNQHRSWSLRRTDDTLLALVTSGLFLPPAELAAPLELKGEPKACGQPGGCGGYSGYSDLKVALDGEQVIVPSDTVGILASSPPYRAVVALASYSGPASCGVLDWTESYVFAVLASP